MNYIIGHESDKCHNCGNWLKSNHRESCPAKNNIICDNYSRSGRFAKYCKDAVVNQIDYCYSFKHFETNVIHKLGEFGLFAVRTVWDQAEKENRKLLSVRIGKNQWETEFQIGWASPVSLNSQKKLHKLKIQDC